MMSLILKRAVFRAICCYGLVSAVANAGNYDKDEIKELEIVDRAAGAG